MQLKVLRHPILVVSPWFEARRSEYQAALLRLSETGSWNDWVAFFAAGVEAAATSTHERIDQLLGLQEEFVRRVREAGFSGVAQRVAGELIGAPILRAPLVAARHNVTQQAAMNALRKLAQLEILTERVLRGRVSFRADRVVELLSR
jgi:Fic family protein